MIQALELGNDDNSPLEKILNVVSEHLNIGTKEILSKSRIKKLLSQDMFQCILHVEKQN